jgi:hypothetical protein
MHLSLEPLQVDVKTTGCDIPDDERARWQRWLEELDERVRSFANPSLEIHVAWHARSEVHNSEFKLKLPGRNLFVREKDAYLDLALERGLHRLGRKVDDYREHPYVDSDENARRQASRDKEFVAPDLSEAGPLAQAVDAGDYRAFRRHLSNYEDWLNQRAGRLVQRNADAQAALGADFLLGDVVEEVYLTAFDRFAGRPANVPLSEWLEGLIQPSIRALLRNTDEEEMEIGFARTLMKD